MVKEISEDDAPVSNFEENSMTVENVEVMTHDYIVDPVPHKLSFRIYSLNFKIHNIYVCMYLQVD